MAVLNSGTIEGVVSGSVDIANLESNLNTISNDQAKITESVSAR